MSTTPSIKATDEGEDYIHVRFRDPDDFDEIRTPDWAQEAAQSVSDGSKVRMGRQHDGDEWSIQSVLIKKNVGESKAKEQAAKIIEKIES